MRRVARRPATQHAWEVATRGHQEFFFEKSVQELDGLQLNLVMWIGFYKDIYSMTDGERPTIEDIEDDRELDLWCKRRMDTLKMEQLTRSGEAGGGGYVDPGDFHGRAWNPG